MRGHRRFTAAIVTAVLAFAVTAGPTTVRAGDDQLRVVNRGKHTISEIYATGTVAHLLFGDKSWGKNILGASLPPGAETTFDKGPKPKNAQGCKQDMRFIYTDRFVKIVTELNICRARALELTY